METILCTLPLPMPKLIGTVVTGGRRPCREWITVDES